MPYVPDPTDPTQPVESVIAGTAAAEFRALKAYLSTLVLGTINQIPRRQTVLSGPATAGLPTPGGVIGSTVVTNTAVSATDPWVVTAANGFGAAGAKDYVGFSSANLSYTGLNTNGTMYLINTVSSLGVITTGSTTLAPKYQRGGAIDVTNNQYTYDIVAGKMYLGNGATAPQVFAVVVGQVTVAAAVVSAIIWYAYQGKYKSATTVINNNNTYTFATNIGTAEVNISTYARESSAYSWAQVGYTDAQNNAGVRYGGIAGGVLDKNTANISTGISQLWEVPLANFGTTSNFVGPGEGYVLVDRNF